MELTVNFILIIVGLIICLGGIYFKKAVAGLVGMVSGIEFGAILTLFLLFSSDSDERGAIVVIIVCGAIGAILCATYDRICGAVGAFFNSALVTLFILLFSPFSDAIAVMIFIVLLVASIVAYISYLYDRISFILTTAVTGAFLASVGVTGICYQSNPADMLMAFIFGSTEFLPMLLTCTLVLSVIGIQIQWKYGSGIVIDLDSKKAGHNTLGSDSIYDIKNTAKEATYAAENVTKNLISQIRTIWENYNSEEHKYFLLICGFAFLWPFCQKTIINRTTINFVYTLIRIVSLSFAGCILALVVYCVYHKDKIFNAACVAVLVLGNLFWQRDSVSYFGISGWIRVLLYLIIVVALHIIKEKLNGAEKLIWKLLFSALVIQAIIIPIIDKILIGYAGFSFWNIICWGAAIVALGYLEHDYAAIETIISEIVNLIKRYKKAVCTGAGILALVMLVCVLVNCFKESEEGNQLKEVLCEEDWQIYEAQYTSLGNRCPLYQYYGDEIIYSPIPTLHFSEDDTFQFDLESYGLQTIGIDQEEVVGTYEIKKNKIVLYDNFENQILKLSYGTGYENEFITFDNADVLYFLFDGEDQWGNSDTFEFCMLHPSVINEAEEKDLNDDGMGTEDYNSRNESENIEIGEGELEGILCKEEWEVYDIKDISSNEMCMLDYYGTEASYMQLPTLYFKEDGTFQFDLGPYGMETIGEDVNTVSGFYQIDGDRAILYYGPENQMIIIEHSLGYDAGYRYFAEVDTLSFCKDDIHEFYLLHPSFYE